jgi:hypothetical protein
MGLILQHLENISAEEMAAIRALSVAWHRQQQCQQQCQQQ